MKLAVLFLFGFAMCFSLISAAEEASEPLKVLKLRDGNRIVIREYTPQYAPYQLYLEVTKVKADGSLVESFGKDGTLDFFDQPAGTWDKESEQIAGNDANRVIFENAKLLSDGSFQIAWKTCYQNTFSAAGGCAGRYISTYSASGRALHRVRLVADSEIKLVTIRETKLEAPVKCEKAGTYEYAPVGKKKIATILGYDGKGKLRVRAQRTQKWCYSKEEKRFLAGVEDYDSNILGVDNSGYQNSYLSATEIFDAVKQLNHNKHCALYLQINESGTGLDRSNYECRVF